MHFLNNLKPFISKLICGYTSSIVCKINFGFICLTLTWNASCKKSKQNTFIKTDGKQKLNIIHILTYKNWHKKTNISSRIKDIFIRTSLTDFIPNQMNYDELHLT